MNPNQLMRTNRCSCSSDDRGYKYNKIPRVGTGKPTAKSNSILQGFYIGIAIIVVLGVFVGLIGWVDLRWPE